jgi:uncharacterized membrane protein YeaQ/YmgE (transglycosylase-associated protein family)
MTLLDLIILLIIAGICGSIAQALVGFSRGGCFLSIAVGFIGALLGSWLAKQFGFPDFFVIEIGGTSYPVIWSIIGAVIFVGILNLLTPRRAV